MQKKWLFAKSKALLISYFLLFSHLPLKGEIPIEKRPKPWGEDITWHPERIHDHDLLMFLHATRSMAAFAQICDHGGSPDDGHSAASKDWITANAIRTLHECDYDTGKAIQVSVQNFNSIEAN